MKQLPAQVQPHIPAPQQVRQLDSPSKAKPDLLVFGAAMLLLGIGLIMVFSASSIMGLSDFRDSFHYLKRQGAWAGLGILAMLTLTRVDYHFYKQWALPGILVSFVLLILVLFIGEEVGGAKRWIDLGFFNLQVSELSKLAMVNFAAVYIAHKREKLRRFWYGLVPILVIVTAKFGLILAEPDFGTAAALVMTTLLILFAGGAHLGQLVILASAAAPGLYYLVSQSEYRWRRIMAFLDPWQDPADTGWNIIQSLLAIGSGGLFGLGLGNSRQKFAYLPEHHTDFIFAVLCEELGFLGVITVIALFFVLAWRGLRIALHAPDLYGTLLAVGVTGMLSFQALLNIGVVTGTLPVTGITLPFISYGGSSLLISLSAIGILLNISRQTVQ